MTTSNPTANLNLVKVETTQTNKDFYDAFNGNMDILDALPFPIAAIDNSSSGSTLSSMKFADGTLVCWGFVSHGTSKPVNTQWEGNGGAGWASAAWTVNFPVPFVGTPVIIPWCVDTNRCETFIISAGNTENFTAITSTTATFRYWCLQADNGGSKTAHLLAIGRWK